MRELGLLLIAALVLAMGLEACGGSSRSATSSAPTHSQTAATRTLGAVYFQGAAGGPMQRPSSLELTADGTLLIGRVQWSSWGGPMATGSGNADYHNCTPTCAQGTPHNAVVSIRLFGIRTCSGRQYYSGVTLTLNSGQLLDKDFLQRSWSPC